MDLLSRGLAKSCFTCGPSALPQTQTSSREGFAERRGGGNAIGRLELFLQVGQRLSESTLHDAQIAKQRREASLLHTSKVSGSSLVAGVVNLTIS